MPKTHYVRKSRRRRGLTHIGDAIFLRLQICVSDVKSQEMRFTYVSYEKGHWRRVFTTRVSNNPSHRRHGLLTHISNNPHIGDVSCEPTSPITSHRRHGLLTSVSYDELKKEKKEGTMYPYIHHIYTCFIHFLHHKFTFFIHCIHYKCSPRTKLRSYFGAHIQ